MLRSFENSLSPPPGCVMYGECGKKSIFSSPYNCFSNTAPKKPSSTEFRNALIDTCGQRYSNASVCCDVSQLNTLISSFQPLENFVGACPSCFMNLKALWCDFICDPSQATFLNVTKTS
ncbi:hypothetical protein HMI56_003813, partial [Coelomomyces lativittatus]